MIESTLDVMACRLEDALGQLAEVKESLERIEIKLGIKIERLR